MLASENSSNILQVIILQRKSVHLRVEKSKYILALELFFSEDRLKKQINDNTAAWCFYSEQANGQSLGNVKTIQLSHL